MNEFTPFVQLSLDQYKAMEERCDQLRQIRSARDKKCIIKIHHHNEFFYEEIQIINPNETDEALKRMSEALQSRMKSLDKELRQLRDKRVPMFNWPGKTVRDL